MAHAKTSGRKSSRSGKETAPANRTPALTIPPNVPHPAMVRDLATRLKDDPNSPDLPLVTINRIQPTRSVHILVIWSKWKGMAIPERARVISDAYAAAFPNDNSVVRLPMGLTTGEAFSQGHLEYRIIPLVRPADNVSMKQVHDAMYAAGGVILEVGDNLELRFASRAQAEGAYRRLLEQINKPIWTLSEESVSSESSGL